MAQPAFKQAVVPICVGILLLLFFVQRRGTERIGQWFGPIMLGWFLALATLGIRGIAMNPEILRAFNPIHSIRFLSANARESLFVLGSVFLAVTGGEALYADLGHFGRRPIQLGWFLVAFPALVLNYLGQGGLLLTDSTAAVHCFFQLAPRSLQYPLIALATVATVIASQAVISGTFSLIHQAREFGYVPRLEVVHYSSDGEGKVYVPLANWCLAAATILLVVAFRSSDALAGAYGMAVSGTMLITTILIVVCFRRVWKWSWAKTVALASTFLLVDSMFGIANLTKLFDGGWIPLTVAGFIYLIMSTWQIGRRALELARTSSDDALQKLQRAAKAEKLVRVPATAVYFCSDATTVPITLLVNVEHNGILHERVILLTVATEKVPRVPTEKRIELVDLAGGFVRLIAHYGFMQSPSVRMLMTMAQQQGIVSAEEKITYFVRSEHILLTGKSKMAKWRKRFYAFLNRNAQEATSTWTIPPDQTVGLRISTQL